MARTPTTHDAFNAIAEPQRRRILTLLKDQDRPVAELAELLRLRQSATSKHLRVLREVGLVHVRQVGRQRIYGLEASGLEPIHEWTGGFEQFWNESLDRLNEHVRQLRDQEGEG